MNLYFYSYIFFVTIISLILVRKHILILLISLEFLVLSLLMTILYYCSMYKYSYYFYLMMMTFYVCEGVLGLSVLVLMIRFHGNDYLNSMSMW
nr:NADH dehydrogenase subunit 4L [Shaddai sp. SL-2021a]